MQCHIIIPCGILPFFSFFLVCNVARIVNSGYFDKKLVVFCHTYMCSKTAWSNLLSVVGDYSQFFLPRFFSNTPTTEVEGWSSPLG